MSAGLNHAKAKQQARANQAIHVAGPDTASTSSRPAAPLYGWRTEWDGDPFPVTVTHRTPSEGCGNFPHPSGATHSSHAANEADSTPATCAR